jgi:membrane protein required for colicin V production
MIAALLIGGMVNYLLIQLIENTGMSGTDRFIGMIFGVARGVLVISVLVLLSGLTTLPKEAFWTESQLIPYFQEIAFWLRDLLPQEYAEYFRYTAVESSFR